MRDFVVVVPMVLDDFVQATHQRQPNPIDLVAVVCLLDTMDDFSSISRGGIVVKALKRPKEEPKMFVCKVEPCFVFPNPLVLVVIVHL